MYHSYKSKKKNRKPLKIIIVLILIAGIAYFGNKYKQYLLFWKYNSGKLSREADEIIASTGDDRHQKLVELSKVCQEYCSGNQASAEPFLLLGKISCCLAEDKLGSSFTEIIIYDKKNIISDEVKKEFINPVKYIRKGMAFSASDNISQDYRVILAKSYYYSGYYEPELISQLLDSIDPALIGNADDVRFISIAEIMNGKAERGIATLEKFGKLTDSIKDKFFEAKAFDLAGKYTDAIIKFRNLLENCDDPELKKLANISLGIIFYNQSLFKESLNRFVSASELDNTDNRIRIWLGKNYSSMGDKKKAKQIWSEVPATDRNYTEVKKLLGI